MKASVLIAALQKAQEQLGKDPEVCFFVYPRGFHYDFCVKVQSGVVFLEYK